MRVESAAPGRLQTIGAAATRVALRAGPAGDQTLSLEPVNRLIQRARPETDRAVGPALDFELDPLAVLRSVGERQQHFKPDRRQLHHGNICQSLTCLPVDYFPAHRRMAHERRRGR